MSFPDPTLSKEGLSQSARQEILTIIASSKPIEKSGDIAIYLGGLDHYAVVMARLGDANLFRENVTKTHERLGENPYIPEIIEHFPVDETTVFIVHWFRPVDTNLSESALAKQLLSIAKKIIYNKTAVLERWCKRKMAEVLKKE